MAQRGNLQARLNEGVEAVRRGDKITGRRLLQQVISADPRNEVAWMWMASAVESVSERRACLERALEINPNNQRAQEALRRLELVEAANRNKDVQRSAEDAKLAQRDALPEARGGINFYLVLAAVVLVVIVGAVGFALFNVFGEPQPGQTGQPVAAGEINLGDTSPTPTIDPTLFTPTPILAVVVTLDRSSVTLPPTFTPTFTPTASNTPIPTETPFPAGSFSLLYSGFSIGDDTPLLSTIRGDGTGENPIQREQLFIAAALDSTGTRLAFVRPVGEPIIPDTPVPDPDSTEEAPPPVPIAPPPQLFVASLDDPGSVVQITNFSGSYMDSPTWSPDGSQVAFASNELGNDDVWLIAADGSGEPRRLTGNEGTDRDPVWSPDGRFIAYASDQGSPAVDGYAGSTEIFVMEANGNNPRQLTDANGSSYSPAWSPDSRSIVFISDRGGDADVYIMNADGEGENLLIFDDNTAEDRSPVFAPDGRSVAFISNREESQFQIYLVDLRGDQVSRVTDNNADILSIEFFPQQ